MGSQPTYTNAGIRPRYVASLAAADWSLLVRLPSRVLAAVIAVRTDAAHTAPADLAEPAEPSAISAVLAGLAAIAAARSAGHPRAGLIREVAAAIFASDDPAEGPDLPRPDLVRAECVRAGYVLAQRIPAGDAEEYRRWVRRIGVAALAPTEPVDPIGAAPVRLLDECERALAG
jgi:hypothetical protein